MLEAILKGAFIGRSDSAANNAHMRSTRATTLVTRPARQGRWARAVLAGLVGVGLGLALPATQARGQDDDHERARAAVRAGEVLPLSEVLERLQRSHPGQVLELELEREDGHWIYEVKLLQADGQLLKLDLDARTAQVLSVKRKRGAASQEKP